MKQSYTYNGLILERVEYGLNSSPVNYGQFNDDVQSWIDDHEDSFFVNCRTGDIYIFTSREPKRSNLVTVYKSTVDFINQAHFEIFVNDLLVNNEDMDYEEAVTIAEEKFYN